MLKRKAARVRQVSQVTARDWGYKKSGPARYRQRTSPESEGAGSAYCWPMIFPLMSMLSSTTMLDPASGPPS